MAASPERTGAIEPPASPSRAILLYGGSILFAVALVGASVASSVTGLVALGAIGGLVGLGAIVRFAPAQATNAVFLLFVGLVAIPIDAYLGYREHTGGWPGIRVGASDIALYLMLALAALGALLGRVENPIPRRVLIWMLLVLVQYLLVAVFSPDRMLALFEIAGTLHAFAIAWVVAALFRRDLLGAVLVLIALQMILHSGVAVLQGVTGRPIGATWLGGNTQVLLENLAGGVERLRPAGLFAHPIVYAMGLVITLPLVTAGFVTRRGLLRLLFAVALGLGLVGLLLTLSRGAWLSSLVAIAVLGILTLRCGLIGARQVRNVVVAALAVGLVFGVIFGPRVYERLTRSDAGNVDVRYDLNWIALRMVAAHPIVGTGLNNFVETMDPYDPQHVKAYFPAPAHNLYLLEAAEAGIPSLVLWVGLFASILLLGLHHLPRMHDPELQWIVAAVIAALAGFLFSQLADFSHRLEPLRSLVWVDIGLLFGALHVNRGRRLAARARGET